MKRLFLLFCLTLPWAVFAEFDWKQPNVRDLPLDFRFFVEGRGGLRLHESDQVKDASVAETRLQIAADKFVEKGTFTLKLDVLNDRISVEEKLDLDRGKGWLDLRELRFLYTPPVYWADVTLGRQIVTWGLGDLIFINDLFPKDWQSFLIGRDMEYLKAPSDSLRIRLFPEVVSIDLVYTPQFDPDRYITGEYASYWGGTGIAGRKNIYEANDPDEGFKDDEIALRLHKNIQGKELALYAYDGFWKSPSGMNASGEMTFHRLSVFGASFQANALDGLARAELGWYDSKDDDDGSDPMIRNSEFRLLLGYNRELVKNLTGDFQFYLEKTLDYDNYFKAYQAMPDMAKEENRTVLTTRLTRFLNQGQLTLGFFAFYSPSDQDGHVRGTMNMTVGDRWMIENGVLYFFGQDDHTFYNQFQDNSSVYSSLRYSF